MDDWSRFHQLAFRVRKGKLHIQLHPSLVAEIYSSRPSSSRFLPSITHLDLRTRVNGLGLLLMGPTLDTLHLHLLYNGDTDGNPGHHFFTRIPTSSPSITRLTLGHSSNGVGVDVTSDIANLCRSLIDLRFADLEDVEVITAAPVLSALAGCHYLEEIVMWGSEEDMQLAPETTEPFRSLRRLTVIESSDRVLASFLDGLPPSLTHLQLGQGNYSHLPGDVAVVTGALARH